MDIPTIPGAWYTVATATTCEITDTATGTPLGTAEAGSYTFQAQGNLTTLSDDSALYSKSNFKSAPAALMALGLLGGGASTPALPPGYLAAEFLESTGTQYMQFPEVVVNADSELRWVQKIDKFPAGSTGIYSTIENGMYFRFVISGGGTSVYFTFFLFANNPLTPSEFKSARAVVINKNYIELDGVQYANLNSGADEYTGFCLFAENVGTIYPTNIKIYKFDIPEQLSLFPAINTEGVPCMYDKLSKQAFYNSGTGSFVVGMTLSQARALGKLPSTGGALTISLPTGYDSDSGVMAALDTARANGWTLTIQTYTPEAASASTFAIRRIWVRRTQTENGAHVAADGTRWQVDWCVDMLTPDGSTPDAHGYELFRSQEAAVAYWELTPYVAPESENLLTE